MIKICITDLSECEALDKEDMGRIRGGQSFCGTPPGPLPDIEEMLAKYMDALPELPTPHEPFEPGAPIPIEGGHIDGPF